MARMRAASSRGLKRLRQIIVGAQFQPHDAVHVFAARGQHEHRHLALLAKPLENLETVNAGEHDIEHHQVDSGLQGFLQPAIAFVRRLHREALAAQEFAEQGSEFGVVIDQQDVHG